jgi:hypothetical protein
VTAGVAKKWKVTRIVVGACYRPGPDTPFALQSQSAVSLREAPVWDRWKAIVASIVVMGVVTVVGVVFLFRPIAQGDAGSGEWPAPIAVSVYLVLSVLLLDWAARRTRSSFSAAFVIASAQFIFIVDLLARGERGLLTAVAGTALLVMTWISVAFVHSRLSRPQH